MTTNGQALWYSIAFIAIKVFKFISSSENVDLIHRYTYSISDPLYSLLKTDSTVYSDYSSVLSTDFINAGNINYELVVYDIFT